MIAERPVTLLDGTRGVVRPIVPSDRDALALALENLAPESRYRRFFFDKKQLSDRELTRLADPDGIDHLAFGLAVWSDDGERMTPVAVARCFRDPEDETLAEIAIVTADLWQGNGAGSELMRSLSAAALAVGIRRWFATMYADNPAVRTLLNKFGKECGHKDLGNGIVEVIYEIVEPPGGFFEPPSP